MKTLYLMRGVSINQQIAWARANHKLKSITLPAVESFLLHIKKDAYNDCIAYGQHLNLWELSPYLFLAREYGWRVRIVTTVASPERLLQESGLSLGELTAKAHKLRLAVIPEEWKVDEVLSYATEDGWFRPVSFPASEIQPRSEEILDRIALECAKPRPRIERIRDLVGRRYTA